MANASIASQLNIELSQLLLWVSGFLSFIFVLLRVRYRLRYHADGHYKWHMTTLPFTQVRSCKIVVEVV